MKVYFLSNDSGFARWQRRRVERLRQALGALQRLLTPGRQSEWPALIPIRIAPPQSIRQPQRRNLID